jgi:outer membrane protein assembly factor BamB
MNCIGKRIGRALVMLLGLFVICSVDLSGGQRIVWTSRFGERPWSWNESLRDRGLAVAVDPGGNVYAGGVGFLRKYSSNGGELWKIQFADDTVLGLAVDALGNVYAAFRSYSLIRKYDPNGKELWSRPDPVGFEPDIAVSGSGSIYVTSYVSGYEGIVRKLDANGNQLWLRPFGPPPRLVKRPHPAVDAAGNVYVAATISSFTGGYDGLLKKYDANGAEIWTLEIAAGTWDRVNGVNVDSSGSIYVVGETSGAFPGQGENLPGFVSKFSANGAELWTRQFGTIEFGLISPEDVATDASGNVYVVGTVVGTLPGHSKRNAYYDAFLRKYDARGNELSSHQFAFDTRFDYAFGVAVDPNGGVYVIGGTEDFAVDADAFVTKFVSCASPPGDVNGDCVLNCDDLAAVRILIGKRPGQRGWYAPADLVADNVIDLRDLVFISQKLPVGTRCP